MTLLELLETWATTGVPNDPGTRQCIAEDLLPKLWAAHQTLNACLDELLVATADLRRAAS